MTWHSARPRIPEPVWSGTLLPASRQIRVPHQIAIALAGSAAALVDGPDDEALAAAAVAGREDAGDAGGELIGLVRDDEMIRAYPSFCLLSGIMSLDPRTGCQRSED